jgi:sugar lactone lactonase YvrE
LVNGVALGPNSTSGMALNPEDGFLYAVAKTGGNSWLLRIDPTSAETTVIDDVNNFSKASAATFGTDGTYYLAFGNNIFIHDLVGTLTLIAQASPSASFDAMAINLDGTIMYLAVGNDLWQVVINTTNATIEVPTLIGPITDGIVDYSPDDLSFDDNGVLWALDNAGNILRLELDGTAENVTTLAVNEVRLGCSFPCN